LSRKNLCVLKSSVFFALEMKFSFILVLISIVIFINIIDQFKNHKTIVFLQKIQKKNKINTVLQLKQNKKAQIYSYSIIDMVYVINLKHRIDRRASIEKTLKQMNFNFEIIEGINPRDEKYNYLIKDCFDDHSCPGQVGCQYSHLFVLNQSLQKQYSVVAIFEDDFILQPFVDPTYVNKMLLETSNMIPDWDVIALSLNIYSEILLNQYVNFSQTFVSQLSQITGAQTTGGYILKKTIIPHVYNSFLNCNVKKDYQTAIDQCWKHLQTNPSYKWIGYEPQPGTQVKSYSDIEQHETNYGLT